jgi:hypothetical protein
MRSIALTCASMRSLALTCAHSRSNALKCAQMRSNALNCAQLRSNALNCAQLRSIALNCAQSRSNALKCAQMRSNALKCAQMRSLAIRPRSKSVCFRWKQILFPLNIREPLKYIFFSLQDLVRKVRAKSWSLYDIRERNWRRPLRKFGISIVSSRIFLKLAI